MNDNVNNNETIDEHNENIDVHNENKDIHSENKVIHCENKDDINKSKGGRKRDIVRTYYICKNNKLCCSIENCKKEFSSKISAISLRQHIYEYHKYNKNTD